jgi:hypothetical protein
MARKSKLEQYAEDLVQQVIDGEVGINVAIKDLDKRLEVFDAVKIHRDRLLASRRALLGVGNKLTGSGGPRITSDEVHQWLEAHGPASTQEMATALSTNDAVIRGHMSRGNNERFERNGDGKWHVVDHEKEEDDDSDDGE